jgi:flagellar hook protein FlgE
VGTNLSTGHFNFANFETEERVTSNYSAPSSTLNQSQDGYTAGFLQDISVGQDGVVSGRYSNGEVLNLFAIGLADFNSKQGLERVGGNLFSETRASGAALPGLPGTGGLGVLSSNSLEQSNVDISEEFVKMIVTQKGFQANSRTITTTDQMLQEVVNLKR